MNTKERKQKLNRWDYLKESPITWGGIGTLIIGVIVIISPGSLFAYEGERLGMKLRKSIQSRLHCLKGKTP